MSRERYRERLDRLRDAVVAMGDLVRDRLETAFAAIRAGDGSLAKWVIDRDTDVNRRYLGIERECVDLLARYQPVASDLRSVVAAFKIVTDLERVGDLATNLAEYAFRSDGRALPDVDVERVAALASEMLADAVDAFVSGDAPACVAVAGRDEELDARCEAVCDRILRHLLETTVDDERAVRGDAFAAVSRALLVVRDLERVGDHAVNVAARTLYAFENDERLLA